MSSLALILLAIGIFSIAYIFYGRYIARKLEIDPTRKTPAHTNYDGIDYVPARAPVLLGHHFASIAGAAPIIGPIVAAAFGWVPVALWIFFGGIFIGAVHDFSSLIASVRHQGRSIGEVIEDEIGTTGKLFFLIFSWTTLILVVAVFIIVVGKTFEETPQAASASVLFIFVAVIFGLLLYKFKISLTLSTIIGLVLLGLSLIAGYIFPLMLPLWAWYVILIIYIFVASVTPVWILLQPRDYLNSFILYALMLLGLAGVFLANPSLQLPSFTAFHVESLGYLFPILFVTVACGAISGFHSLVASGTTAKQLNSENDGQVVGYGAMLIESLLAVISLITAAMLLSNEYSTMKGNPIAIFAHGLGTMMTRLGIDYNTGKTFASLAVSAFALTSLDTATRLARFAMQEFFTKKGIPADRQPFMAKNRYVVTLIGVACAAMLVFSGQGLKLWPIFGSANQLLAALALLSVTIWLSRKGKTAFFVKIPMVIMFAITLSALAVMVYHNSVNNNYVLATIALALFVLAVFLAVEAKRRLRQSR